MKNIYILLLLTGFTFFLSFSFQSDTQYLSTEIYSTVKVNIHSNDDFQILAMNDIDFEHYRGDIKTGITIVINQLELYRLKNSGLSYEVLVANRQEEFKKRPLLTETDLVPSKQVMQSDNINGFGYGSMGGYYTYNEVMQKLDSMRLQYPNLISVKMDKGTTEGGKKIWAVKISDNPDVDESATEPVIYFDGLHHAREPQGMASIMYFMYWLLENYNTNPEATNLINNREIYFIPIVNPDGYYYNQTTNPNGGGDWRKNRRNNGSSYGVDLNRNYSYKWGYDNSGSSGTPSSDTYRGPSAASEPETQAVQNLINQLHPKICFSMHSVAGKVLNPFGYNDSAATYNIYSEFASNFTANTTYLYGTVYQMLSYYSNGTTRDYMQSVGTYCWVVECGGSDFWPAQSEIIPIASELLGFFKYLSWVGGSMVDFQNHTILGKGWVGKNDTLSLQIGIKNKGLSETAKNVSVNVSTSYPNITPLTSTISYDSISLRSIKNNSVPFKFIIGNSANLMDEIRLIVAVSQQNVVVSRDTISVIVGKLNSLFSDDAENGISNWTSTSNKTQWDTTWCDSRSGIKSFTDSRYGNSKNSTTSYFALNTPINLTAAVNPRVEFYAKWATEKNYDYTRFQISTDNGSTWTNLPGRYTTTLSSQPSYHGMQKWVYERINLNAYINKTVKFRFNYYTDSGEPGDGFYFDDFKVINYTDPLVGISSVGNDIPAKFNLAQNYPNPFNPLTKINFDLPKNSFVKLQIFDNIGREITTLINESKQVGSYSVDFNGSNLSSGIYFYRIQAGDYISVKSMILLK